MNEHSRQQLLEFADQTTMLKAPLPLLKKKNDFQFSTLITELDSLLTKFDERKLLLLPELKTEETLALFSDFSGEHSSSKYYTYTFLMTGHGLAFYFADVMNALRKEFFKDKIDKEISYKDMQWGGIKRLLPFYLREIDRIPGLLFTVIVDKRIKSFFHEDPSYLINIISKEGFGSWKPKVVEKFLRISHIATYLVTLLSKEDQKLFWMNDHDAITEGNDIYLAKAVQSLLASYGRKNLGFFGFATPFEERSTEYLDMLSLTDLVAGTLQDYFTKDIQNYERSLGSFKMRDQACQIIDWLAHQSFLKKHTVIFRYLDDENFQASNVIFEATNYPDDSVIVPILRK